MRLYRRRDVGRDYPRREHSGRRNRNRQLEIRIVYHALCAHSQLVCVRVCSCRRAHHVLCACAKLTFSRHMRAILRAKVASCVPLALPAWDVSTMRMLITRNFTGRYCRLGSPCCSTTYVPGSCVLFIPLGHSCMFDFVKVGTEPTKGSD